MVNVGERRDNDERRTIDEAKVLEVLRAVERVRAYGGWDSCPWCWELKSEGHHKNCKLDALLSEGREASKRKPPLSEK